MWLNWLVLTVSFDNCVVTSLPQRANVSSRMIFTNPNEKVLQTADAITLIDQSVKGWKVVVVKLPTKQEPGRNPLHVEIPVDSKNDAAVQGWKDVIEAVRK
jgi:hypothetical protein